MCPFDGKKEGTCASLKKVKHIYIIYIYIDRCVFLSSVFVVHPAPSIWCESSGCDFSRFPETLELKIRNVRIPTSDGFKFSPVFPFFAKVNWQLVDQCHSDESSDVPFQGS